MKKLIIFTILIFLKLGLFAQASDNLNFSTIHLVRSGNFIGSACKTDITFPNQRMFNLNLKSHVEYKIFSTGLIYITLETTCPATESNSASFSSDQISIEVESNKEYYVLYNTWKFEQVKKEDIDKHLKKSEKRKMFFSENLDFPINEASIAANNSGPSQGSGFLINNQGYIITNFHVIDGAKKIMVKGIEGDFTTSFEADVVNVDAQNDLALLKLKTNLIKFSTPPYYFGSVDSLKKTQPVMALGYPLKDIMGEEIKVTTGTINSLSGFKGGISQLQFSAAVQPGNSGGPLFNDKGEVIGVVTSKVKSDVADAVSYAIKVNFLEFFLSQIEGVNLNPKNEAIHKWSLPKIVEEASRFVYIIETE